MPKKRYCTTPSERRVVAYLRPKYHTLFLGYTKFNEFRKCEASKTIIEQFLSSLSDIDKKRYTELAQEK
jgi:hypothetical protein